MTNMAFPRMRELARWVEGGPLLPVKTELYQTGLGIEALRALANLAHVTGKEDVSNELSRSFEKQKR